MGKKKKQNPEEETEVVKKPALVPTPVSSSVPQIKSEDKHLDLSVFDEASLEVQKKRHQAIGNVFDSAAEVIQSYLTAPDVDLASKMFPAKLATDLFITQEKFRREDRRLALEEQKLELERLKLEKPEGGPTVGTFNQQNNYINSQPSDLVDIKKKQEELLSSHLKPKKPIE